MSETKDETKPAVLYVVCKMPTGALLELGNKGETNYEKVLLKGANEGRFNEADGRFIPNTVNGYGLTIVSASFWNRWESKNKAIVAEWKSRRLVVAADSRDEADMIRTEGADVKTGFEPFDPNKMPKGLERADKPSV